MSIRYLTYAETYYARENGEYRQSIVDRCVSLFGTPPIDCDGNVLVKHFHKRVAKQSKVEGRKDREEVAEWI